MSSHTVLFRPINGKNTKLLLRSALRNRNMYTFQYGIFLNANSRAVIVSACDVVVKIQKYKFNFTESLNRKSLRRTTEIIDKLKT